MDRAIQFMPPQGRQYKPFTKHVAESRWQTCNCQSCQDKRITLDAMPGEKIDWSKFQPKPAG